MVARHPISRRGLMKGISAAALVSGEQTAVAKDEDWLRSGPLGPLPKRRTHELPLSDQTNRQGWVTVAEFTDEFQGNHLDLSKWHPTNPEWPGRPPSAFSPKNVRVADGKLNIDLKREHVPDELARKGYKDWTAGAVQSKMRAHYGYYEVRSKPMRSPAASTFWFYAKDPTEWTEIDVYEVWPGASGKERLISTNLHSFEMPKGEPDHTSLGLWTAPFDVAADYHVYGLDWTQTELLFFVDGVLIRRKMNTIWHQPLTLNLDVEIMADLAGMPQPGRTVMTYSIDYVRGFRRTG